jgi:hypothetical protein
MGGLKMSADTAEWLLVIFVALALYSLAFVAVFDIGMNQYIHEYNKVNHHPQPENQ